MKTKTSLAAIALAAIILLTACGKAGPPASSLPSSTVPSGALTGPSIDMAPADLHDPGAVAKIYIWPLNSGGSIFLYPWQTASQISADDLVNVCAYNNFLNLPVTPAGGTIYGGAQYVNPNAPADEVEAAIQRHFDVTSEYLRTSSLYNAAANTYEMRSGQGTGTELAATSASQNGSQIVVGVGKPDLQTGIVTKIGTLTIELENGSVVKYISYKLNTQWQN